MTSVLEESCCCSSPVAAQQVIGPINCDHRRQTAALIRLELAINMAPSELSKKGPSELSSISLEEMQIRARA